MGVINASCEDCIIRWVDYKQEAICSNFSNNDWQLIASDIHTDEEWRKFVVEYCELIECYILETKNDDKPIAFIYLYKDSISNNVISIHGGGWGKSIHLSILYYRGLIVMIRFLLNKGIKVRTSCQLGNDRALRFLKSIGFVKYESSDTYHYMWINEKRLTNSAIYKRLYGTMV